MNLAFSVIKHLDFGGGVEYYTRELATRLARRGHRVEVFSMSHYGAAVSERAGVRVSQVPCLRGVATEKLSASFSAAAACALRRSNRADLIHFHSVAAGAFAGLPRLRGIPCVLQMHGVEWERGRWNHFSRAVLRLLERLAVGQADACTGVSQALCDFYARNVGVRMDCITGGVQPPTPVPAEEILRLGLKPRGYILFMGRLVREKGAHHLIRAFRQLNPDCDLVIAGEGRGEEAYRRELQALAGGDPRIRWPGTVEGRLLAELLSHARVFVQPSEMEGLCFALLEAMSYGNLCLASDIPALREVVADAGLLFRSGDIDDLSGKLQAALRLPDAGRALGDRARQRTIKHYSWEPIVDQWEAFYDRVLREKKLKSTNGRS